MDDRTQEAMLRCMHVLSVTGSRSNSYGETDLNNKRPTGHGRSPE